MRYGNVLVLNASYEPLHVVGLRRAVKLVLLQKAEIVDANVIQQVHDRRLPQLSVVRLTYYVRVPQLQIPCTRHAVLQRDGYRCQYCGIRPDRHELTLDHVLPRAMGGQTTWENVVTACRTCNGYKADRTPLAANMQLQSTPRRPTWVGMFQGMVGQPQAWSAYTYQ